MRQVLTRSASLVLRPWVALALLALAGGGSALVLLPLLGVPGYELGEALAALSGLLAGAVGVAAARQEARLIQGRDPRPPRALRADGALSAVWMALWAALLPVLAALAVPWAVAVARALLTSPCNPFANAWFYPLLALPSALLACAAGVACGFVGSVGGAAALYLLLLLGSCAWTAWPLVSGPQVYAFNHFLGYFPGPLYDEVLTVRPGLLWFRVETVLVAAVLLCAAALLLDMRDGQLGWPQVRPGPLLLLIAGGAAVGLLELRATSLGLRMTDAALAGRLGGYRASEHFEVFYPRGKPKAEVERLVRDLEFRYAQVQAFLGGAPKERISVYLYRSPGEKELLVGAGHTQFSKPWRLSIHVNDAPFPHPTLKHELVHAMAAPKGTGPFRVTSRLGLLPLMGIVEGFAVAGDDPAGELTLHEWAAAMRRAHLAPDVRRLLSAGGFYADAAANAYTAAGSFLRHLFETYGQEKLNALYAHGDFAGVYGRSLDALVAEWERFLDSVPLDQHATNRAFARFHEQSLFKRSCAREVVALAEDAEATLPGDPARALELYARCAALQPSQPGFALGQARALELLGRPKDAARVLASTIAEVASAPSLEAQVLLAQADLSFRQGLKQEATEELAQVLALKPGPELERNAEVKLGAAADGAAGPAVWSYFQPGPEDTRLLLLQLALEHSPDNPYLHYLLGRRLAFAQLPGLATAHLGHAVAAPLPDALLREAWRLKLQAEFESGDCEGVRHDVGRLPDLGAAFRAAADEWRARCDFEAERFHGPLVPGGAFR